MKLSFFVTLAAVVKRGSFAAAASENNLSPSAVSLQIKRLEEYFGQALFDRSSLQIKPTPFALEVLALVNDTLENLESLRRRSSPVVQGDAKVGIIESMQAVILPTAMRILNSRYPQLIVRPVRGRSQELIEAVKDGSIDAAVVSQPTDGGAKRLHWHPLFETKMVMLAPPDSVETTVADLVKHHQFIHFDRATNVGRMAARYLADLNLQPSGNVELQSTHAVVAMVSAGLGVSITFWPDRRLAMGFPVREIKLGERAPTMHISLVSRRLEEDNRILGALQHAFRDAALQLPRD